MHACMLSLFSHVQLFVTLWTIPVQSSLSMGFSKQEYWSGLPFPSPGDLPDSAQGSPILLLFLFYIQGNDNPGVKQSAMGRKKGEFLNAGHCCGSAGI